MLVEVLIALVVLAIGVLAIAVFQTTLSRNSDLAKQRTEATRLAQQRIEDLRAYPRLPCPPGLWPGTAWPAAMTHRPR
jgi:Tfp pilus assembly protein PilV